MLLHDKRLFTALTQVTDAATGFKRQAGASECFVGITLYWKKNPHNDFLFVSLSVFHSLEWYIFSIYHGVSQAVCPGVSVRDTHRQLTVLEDSYE